MNNGILVQDVYGKIGFEERLPKSLSGPPSVVNMPYHYPPANNWKNNTQQYLILVYDTTKQNNTTVSLPYAVQAQAVTNFLIDWGDGTTEQIIWTDSGNSRSTFHTYSAHGVYTVIVSGRLGRLGRANPISVPSLIKCYSFGNIGLLSVATGFAICPNLEEAPPTLPTGIAATNSLFSSCTIFNDEKIKYWDTTNVTNMSFKFYQARRFNQDIGSWNISNVTNISSMFGGANSFNNGNSDSINNWNTSNVTNMSNLFEQATVFNQPIGNWNTSNVTSMNIVFFGASNFNQDINNWDTSKVTNMQSMFGGAVSFNQSLNNWNVRKVTNFSSMFQGATSFNSSLSGWGLGADTTGTSCQSMFQGATNFTGIGLDTWDTSKITNMNRMFTGIRNFNADITSWNTSSVTDMTSALSAEGGIFNQNISGWDTSKVTTMAEMFRGNSSFNQPIGSWNVSNVNSMSFMFAGLGGFRSPFSQDISAWDIRKVTTMDTMFQSNALWGTTNYSNALIAWAALPDTNLNSQTITAFAASSTNTLVTSNNHGLVAGSRVNITGTTNYNGDYNVVSVPNTNQFVIAKTFVANDATGTMNHRRSRNVIAGFATNKYSAGAAADARSVLINTYGWTITDGGQA